MAQRARADLRHEFRAIRRLAPILLLVLATAARATTVEEIPSPRPAGWAVDRTGRIRPETLRRLDRLGDEVKAQRGAELTVAVVGSTGGIAPRAFATRLFNRWGIGERQRNDGVLVFAALDDRRVEIVLGDGLSGDANRRASEEIVAQEMVPRFRAGDPAGALREGALACARRILDAAPTPEAGVAAVTPSSEPELPAQPAPEALAPSRPEYPHLAVAAQTSDGNPLVTFLGLLLVASCGVAGYVYVDRLRHRCPRCEQRMERLDDAAVEALLSPVERTEERLGSVRFAVWRCAACNEEKRERHVNLFSGYGSCPSCGARTLASSTWTVEQATDSYGGLERIDQRCESCGYASSYTRSTPQLQRPVDTTSAPGSFSSSSSSTSSASDSGFGGGHSSGDGASGGW